MSVLIGKVNSQQHLNDGKQWFLCKKYHKFNSVSLLLLKGHSDLLLSKMGTKTTSFYTTECVTNVNHIVQESLDH